LDLGFDSSTESSHADSEGSGEKRGPPRKPSGYDFGRQSQQNTPSAYGFSGAPNQFPQKPFGGHNASNPLHRSPRSSSRKRRTVPYWLSEDESSLYESSLATDELNRNRFANTRFGSSNIGTPYSRPAPNFYSVPQIEESESEDSDSDDSESDFISTGSSSTPTPKGNKPNPGTAYDIKSLQEAFKTYESSWASLTRSTSLPSPSHTMTKPSPKLTFHSIPWPQHPAPASISDITASSILTFLKHGAGIQNGAAKMAVRQALLRFHPDKSSALLKKVEERDRERVREGCVAVARCLNEINKRV